MPAKVAFAVAGDAFACPCASERKAFVCLWQPSHLSLSGQRNVAQREATPLPRLADLLFARFASRGRAFRQHIHVLAKRHRHPCRCPLRGLSSPPRRCRGAPGRATRILRVLFRRAGSRAELRRPGAFASALAFCFCFSASSPSAGHDGPLLCRGPLCGGEAGSTGRAAGADRDVGSFSPGQDALSKSPAPAHGLVGQDAQQAPSGVAFSFGYFSLGHAREK
ncbi:hypothetical protein EJMOOK_04330 [Rhodanobacter sp. Root179]